MAAIVCGLALGKPAGFILASWLAVKLGIAEKPTAYSWRQLAGAGALAGIGFTMSLFIAGEAFPVRTISPRRKIAVFGRRCYRRWRVSRFSGAPDRRNDHDDFPVRRCVSTLTQS